MEYLLDIYRSWTWLFQSLAGAIVYSILQLLGSKGWDSANDLWSKSSKQRRTTRLRNELARLNTISGDLENRTFAISVLLFGFSRRIVKGLIWISLGLIFGAISSTLGVIGFIGGIYYFFSALSVVSRIDDNGDTNDKMIAIDKELSELDKSEDA